MFLRSVDKVLVISVNWGNTVQTFSSYVIGKHDRHFKLNEEMDYEIYKAGACGVDKKKIPLSM